MIGGLGDFGWLGPMLESKWSERICDMSIGGSFKYELTFSLQIGKMFQLDKYALNTPPTTIFR